MIIKPIKRIVLLIIFILLLYLFISTLLVFFPQKRENSTEEMNQSIQIIYDEMHSDIALNLDDLNLTRWSAIFPLIKERKRGYHLFGWGDRETYMNTPTWDDLELSTALKALFLSTPSVMHIEYHHRVSKGEGVKTINVTEAQIEELERHLLKDFSNKRDFYKGFGRYDLFYDAPQSYSILNTCNTWTGERLRDANITMSYWTPFSWNVIYALP